MNQNQLTVFTQLEADLWEAADQLRANSKLTSSEYCMPVLGVIFLRHASNRFEAATRQIEADQASGRMPRRPLIKDDYVKRRALYLPEEARYESIMALPKEEDLDLALVDAMAAIEKAFEPLEGVLPKEYTIFERTVLEDLLRIFNREALRAAGGDVFGRIYEYFLMKFAIQRAQDNGEFFTPPSLVQTMVNVIEPDHGIVFDPACGSGRLAKMNLAVHGLEGDIREANTFYEDVHTLVGTCDFVMANPPFNVDMVDAEKVDGDARLPFGLPGVNKQKKVSNGNYLWIPYFYSYLNATRPRRLCDVVTGLQRRARGANGDAEQRRLLVEAMSELGDASGLYKRDRSSLVADIEAFHQSVGTNLLATNDQQHTARQALDPIAEKIKGLIKQVDLLYKLASRATELGEGQGESRTIYDRREITRLIKQLDTARKEVVEQLKQAAYFYRQLVWLQDRFPEAKLADVPGLVKLVDRKEIEAADSSLTPGRYVGVAPAEQDDDFDFEAALRDIHAELASLNDEAAELARNMRLALPNASFIGFTGTPLFTYDHLTRRIFGTYVSRYDFKRSE
jgi:type I restriction-modification system DNA methylase subunit